ncbi:MAG TPA: hypothetical protein VEJ38_01095 [Candidatus Acidoferrales bacterium]|nr:hypothetical protein [Candidatus Acidoferrales bacterium]
MKSRSPASTHKKVVVLLLDRKVSKGYLNPSGLGRSESIDLLTLDGEHEAIARDNVKAVYFVREFKDSFEPERKSFLSRPKLDGLWVRLRFRDDDAMEGIVANNLLDLLDTGVQLTPPDLHGNVIHMFVPRSALAELKVLGVVGAARRSPRTTREIAAVLGAQSKLFSE